MDGAQAILPARRRQAGQILIMTGLSMAALVAAIGLALDSGIGYLVKAKLNAAVDAAGIAAARAVTLGNDPATQTANAVAAADKFFAANYPDGYLGTSPKFGTPSVAFDRGKITITTSAQAVMPVRFMGIAGVNAINVGARAETVRKDLDLAFVMDTSGSMSGVAAKVRAAARSFVDHFNPVTDRVALIHFSAGAEVDDPIRLVDRGFDRATMKRHIQKFDFSGFTNHAEGMWHGRDQLNRISQVNRSSLRVIVFFSDGSPNTFASYFDQMSCAGAVATGDGEPNGTPYGLYDRKQQDQMKASCDKGYKVADAIQTLPDDFTPPSGNTIEFPVVTHQPRNVSSNPSWRNINLAARNLPEAIAAKARSEGIYIFTLGLGALLKDKLGVPDPSGTKTGEDLLKCMANTGSAVPDSLPARCHDPAKPQGIYCYAATEDDLQPCFSQLASEILRLTK